MGINNIFNNYINNGASQTSKKNIKRIMWSTIKYLGDKSLYVTAMHGQELQKKYIDYVSGEGMEGSETKTYYDRVLKFLRWKLADEPRPEEPLRVEKKTFYQIITSQKWSFLLSERPQFIRSMMSVPKIDRVLMDGVKIVKHLNAHVEDALVNEYIDISNREEQETYQDISEEFHRYKREIHTWMGEFGGYLEEEIKDKLSILEGYDISPETPLDGGVSPDTHLDRYRRQVKPLKIIKSRFKISSNNI